MSEVVMYRYLNLLTRQFLNRSTGHLCVVALKHHDGRVTTHEKWFSPRDVLNPVVAWCRAQNSRGYNIYVSWALFSRKERRKESMIESAAFVADWDGDEPEKVEGMSPTLTVETSPGRYQEVFIHDPLGLADADARYKSMARRLGCDIGPSGDPVHLWRVPGTTNFPHPRKKRGPTPSKWDLKVNGRVALPEVVSKALQPHDEWPARRKGRPLTAGIRSRLKKDWDTGERSEAFYRVTLDIAKLGWGIDDIADAMAGTAFADKYGRRLGEEIERCIGKSDLGVPGEIKALNVIRYKPEDVAPPIHYLIKPYLPRGEFVLVDGDPGVGKTSLVLRMIQILLTGVGCMGLHPEGGGGKRILYMSIESDYERMTLPLLKAMGVEREGGFFHYERPMRLDGEGFEALAATVKALRVDLVVLDNLVSYLPQNVDMNRSEHADQFGKELIDFARQHDVTIIGLRHNAKGSKSSAMYRGIGSIGWAGSSRSQLVVRADEEEDEYIVAHAKHSYGRPGPSLVYQFTRVEGRAVVEVIRIDTKRGADEVNDIKRDPSSKKKVDDASEWLREQLSKGPVEAKVLKSRGEALSFDERLLQRARDRIGAKSSQTFRGGGGSTSVWSI